MCGGEAEEWLTFSLLLPDYLNILWFGWSMDLVHVEVYLLHDVSEGNFFGLFCY